MPHVLALRVWEHWRWFTHRGVGSTAHAATVRLGVFDSVSRQVDLEGGGVRVSSVTVGALVRLVFIMWSLVGLQKHNALVMHQHTLTQTDERIQVDWGQG